MTSTAIPAIKSILSISVTLIYLLPDIVYYMLYTTEISYCGEDGTRTHDLLTASQAL